MSRSKKNGLLHVKGFVPPKEPDEDADELKCQRCYFKFGQWKVLLNTGQALRGEPQSLNKHHTLRQPVSFAFVLYILYPDTPNSHQVFGAELQLFFIYYRVMAICRHESTHGEKEAVRYGHVVFCMK
jgi:hypothetical protein